MLSPPSPLSRYVPPLVYRLAVYLFGNAVGLSCPLPPVQHLDLLLVACCTFVRCFVRALVCSTYHSLNSIFSVLMGDNVGPRKEFINEHANNLKLDDLDF